LHSYQHIQSCHLLWDFIVDDVSVAQYLASLKFYHLVPVTQLQSHYLSVSHTSTQRQQQHAAMSLSIDIPDVNASLSLSMKGGVGIGHSHSHGSSHSDHSHGNKQQIQVNKPIITVEASPSTRASTVGSGIANNSNNNNNNNNNSNNNSNNSNAPVTFEKSYTLYKDRDIVQSFCINTKNSSQFVLATTRGIMEITLDATKLSEMSQVIEDDTDPNAPHPTPAPTTSSVQRDKHELVDLPSDPVPHHHPQLLQLNSSSSLVGAGSQTNLMSTNANNSNNNAGGSSLKYSSGIPAGVVHSVSGGGFSTNPSITVDSASSNNNNNQVQFNSSTDSMQGGMKRSDSMVHMSPFHFLNARKKGQAVRLKDLVVNTSHPSPNGPICQWIEVKLKKKKKIALLFFICVFFLLWVIIILCIFFYYYYYYFIGSSNSSLLYYWWY